MKLKKLVPMALLGGLLASGQASALNIVLTNDDGWDTANIKTMAATLRAAGHDVIMSAPCTGQSGKGGSMNFLKPVNVDSRQDGLDWCVGDTDEDKAFKDFTEGTPVMSVLHGIDVIAHQRWGSDPDLVISGPNEGNNLGFMNNNSGTLGAAMVVLARGIPAIAVSAADGDESKSQAVADIVMAIVAQLEAARQPGEPLLPKFTGLNVNTPSDVHNPLGYRLTDVAWFAGGHNPAFTDDMSASTELMQYVAMGIAEATGMTMEEAMQVAISQYQGVPGLSFSDEVVIPDDEENGEGRRVQEGYVAISTIDAHVQASRAKVAWTAQTLNALAESE